MSIIGLYDWDLNTWKQPICFNLELMKISAYHKQWERDVVRMQKKPDPDSVSKLFIQKDYEDDLYPVDLVTNEKVFMYGLALSDEHYVPMPVEYEEMVPDTSIYEDLALYYRGSQTWSAFFNKMIKAQHLRLTDDEGNVIPHWERQLDEEAKRIYVLHDNNITFTREVQGILSDFNRVGFKFSPVLRDQQQLDFWMKLDKTPHLRSCVINFLPEPIAFYSPMGNLHSDCTFTFDNPSWHELGQLLLVGKFIAHQGNKVSIVLSEDAPTEKLQFVSLLNDYFLYCMKKGHGVCSSFAAFERNHLGDLLRHEKISLFSHIKNNSEELFNLLYDVEKVEMVNNRLTYRLFTNGEVLHGGAIRWK